jgi:protein TonB
MKQYRTLRYLTPLAALTATLAACTSTPLPPQVPLAQAPATVAATGAPPATFAVAPQVLAPQGTPRTAAAQPFVIKTSNAINPRAYRADAAGHLYALNSDRIYKGRMPPLLYAIGTLQVEVDGNGSVRNLSWMRAPKHAPEVIAEIERTVRAAAPYPVPAKMGKVVYTDTWLWHKSGKFQLDTLTEGQD